MFFLLLKYLVQCFGFMVCTENAAFFFPKQKSSLKMPIRSDRPICEQYIPDHHAYLQAYNPVRIHGQILTRPDFFPAAEAILTGYSVQYEMICFFGPVWFRAPKTLVPKSFR